MSQEKENKPAELEEKPESRTPPAAPPRPRKRRWLWWLWLILLLLLAGSGWFSYRLWQQLQQAQEILSDRVQDSSGQFKTLEQQLQALNQRLENEIKPELRELSQTQRGLRDNIGDLYARQRRVGDSEEQRLAQIAYLLRVAQQRLNLGQDMEAALTALRAADQQLSGFRDPAVIRVREQLTEDIHRLEAVKLPDIGGMALSLRDYANRVEDLPLLQGRQQAEAEKKPAQSSAETAENPETKREGMDWSQIPAAIWGELKQLVVIRYNEGGGSELLAPAQRYFLTQNLRLKLESARLALLRRDTDPFHAALKDARQWLDEYYDQGAPEVKSLAASLETMRSARLDPELPDISRSLSLLSQLSGETGNALEDRENPTASSPEHGSREAP